MSIISQARPGSDGIGKECDRFRLLSLSYQDFAKSAGIALTAFRDPALPYFTALSASQRSRVLDALGICVRVCESARSQGHAMSDSPALTWQAIHQLGLRPTSDIFGVIGDESVIEIHSPEGTQLFRNFNFFRYCSYSVEELYSRPWHELYERDEGLARIIADAARSVYSGEIRSARRFDLPPHGVREISSPSLNEVRLTMEWIAPLYREGTAQPGATICVETLEFMDNRRNALHGRSTASPAIP